MSNKNMLNKETVTEFITTRKAGSLGESVDILRECIEDLGTDVQELYDLDEDNYKKIQSLIEAVKVQKKQINGLQTQVRRYRGRMILGFIGLGGLVYFGYKAIDQLQERMNRVEEKQKQDEPEKKAEESDG